MRKTLIAVAMLVSAGLLVVGCDDPAPTPSTSSPTTPAAAEGLPSGLMLTAAPAEAKDVLALKGAKAGDEVVLRGKIGGRAEPFVEGRAVFQVVDAGLKSCKDIPGDTCATPWDYCCEPEVNQKSASVQVVGADGKPLRTGLKGVGGLQPLSEVTIKGTVVQAGEAGPVLVNATGIHVKG